MTATPALVIRRRLAPRGPQLHRGTLILRQPKGQGRELRVVVEDTAEGPALAAFMWRKNQAGEWWPCPRGLRVPAADLRPFVEAIVRALRG